MLGRLLRITLGLVLLATFAPATAADAPLHGGITGITDGLGNPIAVDVAAGTARGAARASAEDAPVTVRRGQAWWPYDTALPPYTSVDTRVEAMSQDEIQVNGVAILSSGGAKAAFDRMPRDLVLETGSQLVHGAGFYLVKIEGYFRNQAQVDALEAAGAVLGEYLNINTYIAKIPSASYAAVGALPFVTFVGDYHPAYKISPRIGLEEIPIDEAIDPVTGLSIPWLFEVTLHRGADVDDVLHDLATLGLFPRSEEIVASDAVTVVLVRTAPEAVPALARIPGVKWIAERTYPRLLASSTSPATIPMLLQNNGAFTTNTGIGWKLWNVGIDGTATGQIVTMMDTGLNTKMEHFAQNTATAGTVGASHRKVAGYDNYGGDVCVTSNTAADGGHGTWTSQHAVGSISNMTTNPDTIHTPTVHYDNGIARGAKVYFQDIGTSTGALNAPLDLGPSIAAAIGKGSYVQNHSWGTSANLYDTTATNLDAALFSNPNFVVTVAAGNRGAGGGSTIGSPSTAKNAICVGGVDAASPSSLFIDCGWDGSAASCSASTDLGSSRGPVATSNRIKPDILAYMASSSAVGGEIEAGNRPSAMCQTDATKTVYWDWNNTNLFGGTSFSAPEVAALAALVRDYFQQGFYPTGAAVPGNALTPSGSLVKAMLLASGEDMLAAANPTTSIAVSKRYSNDVGYGRANLPSVLHIGSGAPFLWVQNNDTLGDGSTKTFFYNINGNSIPLRVMMTYYDAAGNALQKDCDLKVTVGSTVYWGNNFSGGWSTSGTATRDHTNNTEGVFLDAAHGLPASGTVRVDVIGFNNPGGMNYSLAVVGNVASQSVTQVSLNQGKYSCAQTVGVTVNDAAASSPVSVTLTSRNSASAVIDTQVVSCTGSNGVFTGSIQSGSGIVVADGGTITATYNTTFTATSGIDCQLDASDSGFLIRGGCDNDTAGTDEVVAPLFNGGVNEYYNKYMDGGEYSSYTVGFVNQTGVPLTDVYVTLSFSGPGASKMSVLNNPVHVGPVPVDGLSGAVFQLYTDPSVAALTSVNLDFDITSPADGFTTARRQTHVQTLQANDTVARQVQCSTFSAGLAPWYESTVTGRAANSWRWSGSAAAPATVGSENRVGALCGSATANAAAMVGNSGTTTANNFASNADSFLLQNFQPALRGNGPNGQPYHYVWKWHSFYKASELLANQGGGSGFFYNDQWNSATNPTADQALGFPISLAYFYHTIYDYVGTWNWETANTGIPDDPRFDSTSGGAPNQVIITFGDSVSGLATNSTWFAYGHEHLDIVYLTGTAGTRRDIAFDNDNLVYDEYYQTAQAAACGAGTQVGQVAFERYTYDDCPSSTAMLSVVDADAVGPIQVTVTSPGTGDSEVVTLTGAAPYFSGTLTLATDTGRGSNNGVLFVLPSETIGAAYTDSSPAGSTTATTRIGCTGGNVVYVSNAQVSDSGDNDGIADNNESVTLDITIQNNLATPLTNAKVTIFSDSPNVDCISDAQALYGTVGAGASATNPIGDRFSFHVAAPVTCADWQSPPTARFTVAITGDGLDGSSLLQTFTVNLDLDATATGGSYTYSQTFGSDPGWATGATPDDSGTCGGQTYVNNFHWCAACGNGGGGYGAWIGNSPFGTSGQNYSLFDSSTLYSPAFVANGNVTLQFSTAYRTEATYDGAIVQSKVGAGAWTTLGFTTPAQSATTASDFCSPLAASVAAWNGNGVSWTTTNVATVAASAGQPVQFRWRLGGDDTNVGASYGGFGVDNVTVTNLKQTLVCETTRNTLTASNGGTICEAGTLNLFASLVNGATYSWSGPNGFTSSLRNPAIASAGAAASGTYTVTATVNGCPLPPASTTVTVTPEGGSCNDGNACTLGESCQAGACTGTPVVCSASDACHLAGSCNPGTGLCDDPVAPNGTACNDANACTRTDTCQAGACTGANPVLCSASDACHLAGSCDPGTGLCDDPVAPDGTACNDANACTQTDTCQAGACTGANPVLCSASDPCHLAGTCNTGTGLCSNPTAPDGTACDDADACTTADACTSGSCVGTPGSAPGESSGLAVAQSGGSSTISWVVAAGASRSDVLRGLLSGLPVGPGGGDEVCFADVSGSSVTRWDRPDGGDRLLVPGTRRERLRERTLRVRGRQRRALRSAGLDHLSVASTQSRGGRPRAPASCLAGRRFAAPYAASPITVNPQARDATASAASWVAMTRLRRASFLPKEGRGQVDRVQRSQRGRKRLGRAGQDRASGLHDLELREEPEDRFATAGEVPIGELLAKAQPIERPEALDFHERAGHRPPHLFPLRQAVALAEDDAQDDGRIEIRDQRSPRSSRRTSTTSTLVFRGGGSGTSWSDANLRRGSRTRRGSPSGA